MFDIKAIQNYSQSLNKATKKLKSLSKDESEYRYLLRKARLMARGNCSTTLDYLNTIMSKIEKE